jgi:dTDP-4-dehydrorhamnose reductase
VDAAETPEGRRAAWAVNVAAVAAMTAAAREHGLTVVHVSSDYVFDGTQEEHREDEPFSPLGVYGQTKAAGDALVSTLPHHYVVRTSWVVGDGGNFVRTMASLAARDVDPAVVDDQIGRLTFADEIARGIKHLLDPVSWADVAKAVFAATGHDPARVTGVSTAEYFAGKSGIAPRPARSALSLERITATGFEPEDQQEALRRYLREA